MRHVPLSAEELMAAFRKQFPEALILETGDPFPDFYAVLGGQTFAFKAMAGEDDAEAMYEENAEAMGRLEAANVGCCFVFDADPFLTHFRSN